MQREVFLELPLSDQKQQLLRNEDCPKFPVEQVCPQERPRVNLPDGHPLEVGAVFGLEEPERLLIPA